MHGLTSIGRRLDRNLATNRAVLRLMPIVGAAAAVAALLRGSPFPRIVWWGFAAPFLVLGAWALARELAPDDNAAAFVSTALGVVTLPLARPLSFLALLTTILLIRIVNRTTGLRARVTDSVAVTLLVFAMMYLTGNPVFGSIAAIAFALDAVLSAPLRRQWVFAALCLLGALALFGPPQIVSPTPSRMPGGGVLLLATVTAAYLLTLVRTRALHSCGDVTGTRLVASRVRAGMLVALLVAWQALLFEEEGATHAVVIWSALAGVAVTVGVIRPLTVGADWLRTRPGGPRPGRH